MALINELRIGNYVWDNYSGNMEVSLIDSFNESIDLRKNKNSPSGRYTIEDIDPIPLTEQWLKDFGFEKINHISGYSFWSLKRRRKSIKPSICIYSNYTTVGNNTHVNHCEYLHQLQNLYFVLTSKELTKQ